VQGFFRFMIRAFPEEIKTEKDQRGEASKAWLMPPTLGDHGNNPPVSEKAGLARECRACLFSL